MGIKPMEKAENVVQVIEISSIISVYCWPEGRHTSAKIINLACLPACPLEERKNLAESPTFDNFPFSARR